MTGGTGASRYPGHMARAGRLIRESLQLVDAVVEIADARLPRTSRHGGLSGLVAGKRTFLVLNKMDLAEAAVTAAFVGAALAAGQGAAAVDSRGGAGVPAAVRLLTELAGGRRLRLMVVGLPNVGKSAFINRVAGRRRAPSADRPGVTRGVQWIRLGPGLELLDTPGILRPQGASGETLFKLAACGILAAESYDPVTVAAWLWEQLTFGRPDVLPAAPDAYTFLADFGRARGFVRAGGVLDEERAAVAFLLDFRKGHLGRFTLDAP